jgi:hypothetical protein
MLGLSGAYHRAYSLRRVLPVHILMPRRPEVSDHKILSRFRLPALPALPFLPPFCSCYSHRTPAASPRPRPRNGGPPAVRSRSSLRGTTPGSTSRTLAGSPGSSRRRTRCRSGRGPVLWRCRVRKDIHVLQDLSYLRLVSYSPSESSANESQRARTCLSTRAPESLLVRQSHRAAQLRQRDWTRANRGPVEEDANTPLSKRSAKRFRHTAASCLRSPGRRPFHCCVLSGCDAEQEMETR